MSDPRGFLDPVTVAQIERLEVIAISVVEGFLRGLHQSAAKGSSIEYAEHRPYVPGDDVRHLDWRAYAKTDRFYLKEYEDETNLRATLLVDASASMGFGSAGISKLRYACCLASAFAYLLLRQRDAVGLAVADTALRTFVPPRATAENLAGIFAALDGTEARGKTALGAVARKTARRIAGRSMVLIFSDFLDEPREALSGMAQLRHQRCEVVAFHVLDPAEVDLPFDRWMVFRDAEDRSVELRLDARQVREVYLKNLASHLEVLRRGCAAAEVDYVVARTSEPFERLLARYLTLRSRRR